MARALGTITIGGVAYRVLRLDGGRGPAFLLRAATGEVFGLFRHGHEPTRLYASALRPGTPAAAFDGLELFDEDGRLAIRESTLRDRRDSRAADSSRAGASRRGSSGDRR